MQAALSYGIACAAIVLGVVMLVQKQYEASALFYIASGIFTVAAALESQGDGA